MRLRGDGAWFYWLLIVLTVVLCGVLPVCACVKYFRDHDVAMEYAQEWATKVENVKLVECVSRDTDYDGYVACTVYRMSADPLYIECAAALSFNDGCRGRKGE